MDIELDDANQKLYGDETINYINNSPDQLPYLWVQLDQNVRKKDAPSTKRNGQGISPIQSTEAFVNNYVEESFDGGFNIQHVKDKWYACPISLI